MATNGIFQRSFTGKIPLLLFNGRRMYRCVGDSYYPVTEKRTLILGVLIEIVAADRHPRRKYFSEPAVVGRPIRNIHRHPSGLVTKSGWA